MISTNYKAKEVMNDNELMNRRRFFKKTAKEMLPMLGAFMAAPTVIMSTLTSCGPDGCDGCEAACRDNCDNSCSYGCGNGCEGDCSSTCEGSSIGKPLSGTIDGHEYVDLGLSVLWAKYNIGSSTTNDTGETIPFVLPEEKDEEKWLQRFKSLNLKENDVISASYLDSAKNMWGSKWRMPLDVEYKELINNCTTELLADGVKFVSKLNGESIIFPFKRGIYYFNANLADTEMWSGIYCEKGPDSYFNSYYYGIGLRIHGELNSSSDLYKSVYMSYIQIYPKEEYEIPKPIRPVAERENGSVSTCSGTCTANCSDNCSNFCRTECGYDCKSVCGGCSDGCFVSCTGGCGEGCIDGCQTTCKGGCNEKCTKTCADSCYSDCNNGCTTTCADACKAQTSQYCSNCASNCSSGCTTTCADACKAQTSQGCSNCATQCSGDCQHECTYGCGRQCYTSCGGQCKGKCGGSCQVECTSYAKNTPCASCGGTCRSACNENCTYDCYTTCKSIGYK